MVNMINISQNSLNELKCVKFYLNINIPRLSVTQVVIMLAITSVVWGSGLSGIWEILMTYPSMTLDVTRNET